LFGIRQTDKNTEVHKLQV